jgi:hypothetical protein
MRLSLSYTGFLTGGLFVPGHGLRNLMSMEETTEPGPGSRIPITPLEQEYIYAQHYVNVNYNHSPCIGY